MARLVVRRWLTFGWWDDLPPPPQTPLWIAWRALIARFPLWWFMASGLVPGSQRWAALDDVGRIRVKPRVSAALAALERLDVATIEQLAVLARTNLERHTYFSRIILLGYFTIPLTVGAVLLQMAPTWLDDVMTHYGPAIAGGFAGAAVAVVVRLMTEARARQIVTIIDLAKVERGLVDQKL